MLPPSIRSPEAAAAAFMAILVSSGCEAAARAIPLIAQVSLVKSVNLTHLTRSSADLELTYLGDEVQFVRALNQADLMIVNSGEGLQTMTLMSDGGAPSGSGSMDLTQPAAPQ